MGPCFPVWLKQARHPSGARVAVRLAETALLLSTDIWVGALIRRAEQGGAFPVVVRKGDPRAGAVLLKVLDRRSGTAKLYSEATRGDGERVWMQPVVSQNEADLDAYAQRALSIDPDVWIVEIDDAQGRHFLVESVEQR